MTLPHFDQSHANKKLTGTGKGCSKNVKNGSTMDGFFIRHSCLHAATDVTTDGEDIRHQHGEIGMRSEMKKY